MIKVLLVTSWKTDCGIAEHSAYLKEAVEAADPSIEITPSSTALDPSYVLSCSLTPVLKSDVVHLNYQAGLHSRWTPAHIRQVQESGTKVIVTYHDTGVPNSEQCKAIIRQADAAVVHEPFDDLPEEKVRYWRMGVPDWEARYQHDRSPKSWCGGRPILGTIGFPYPWKNYDQLAKVTAANGWALLILAPGATGGQMTDWLLLNRHTSIVNTFTDRHIAVARLSDCDATAFTYVCHNTGQSAALLMGIAARRPVIALETCRQFRALNRDSLGNEAIYWADTFDTVGMYLRHMPTGRVDPGIVALAEQDGWAQLGRRYAGLYQEIAR